MSEIYIYNAVVKRNITDEIEIQVKVQGKMDPYELQKSIEHIAQKVDFNPTITNSRIDSQIIFMELVEEKNFDDAIKGYN